MNRLIQTSILAAAVLALTSAVANEGAFEISPLCVATGCFDGDSPGYPVTISRPGRYVLTGNLDVNNAPNPADTSAIWVGSATGPADAVIDLNGFEVRGPVTCDDTPVTSCAGDPGSGSGIVVLSNSRATILNGRIQGMGQFGIRCNAGGTICRVENVVVEQNRAGGIFSNSFNGGSIDNVTALRNGDIGIFQSRGAIRNSVSRGNQGIGILADRSSLESTTSASNGSHGITASGVVRNSTFQSNGGDGILCNGCSAFENQILLNNGFGLNFDSVGIHGRNYLQANTSGDLNSPVNADVQTEPNLCFDGSC
jgi:hypothetical protein